MPERRSSSSSLMIRVSGVFGIFLMLVYWTAHLDFPYVTSPLNFIIDEHIVHAAIIVYLMAVRAGSCVRRRRLRREDRYDRAQPVPPAARSLNGPGLATTAHSRVRRFLLSKGLTIGRRAAGRTCSPAAISGKR
jgi:hypothetical protein